MYVSTYMRLVAGKGRSEVVIYAPKELSKVGALQVNSPRSRTLPMPSRSVIDVPSKSETSGQSEARTLNKVFDNVLRVIER